MLREPKKVEDLNLPKEYVSDLVLKWVYSRGYISFRDLCKEMCISLHILDEVVRSLLEESLVEVVGKGLLPTLRIRTTAKGREEAKRIISRDPYIGPTPVKYEDYLELSREQAKRYPLEIPEEKIEEAFSDVINLEEAKSVLIEALTTGMGLFIYGPPGTGKTYLMRRASKLLPPVVIPRAIGIGRHVVKLFDPDFHRLIRGNQPEDKRYVKVEAPSVPLGTELRLEAFEMKYDERERVIKAPPQVKAHGGLLLIDDLGRQRDKPEDIMNRLIIPLEERRDFFVIGGTLYEFPTDFTVILSTNLSIWVMETAHLRRVPYYISMPYPSLDDMRQAILMYSAKEGEEIEEEAIEVFLSVYKSPKEGGLGVRPAFSHARDLIRIAKGVRMRKGLDSIDGKVMREAILRHSQIMIDSFRTKLPRHKIRTLSVEFEDEISKEVERDISSIRGVIRSVSLGKKVYLDTVAEITTTEILEEIRKLGLKPVNLEIIAEQKHLGSS